jgi:hypothetical protein
MIRSASTGWGFDLTGDRFQWPTDEDRMLIIGTTGSGKTRAAIDQLSRRSIDSMVWIAIDFKGHDTLYQMPVTDIMDLDDPIPDRPGLYYVKAPLSKTGNPTAQLIHRAAQRGQVGLFIDEMLAVGTQNEALGNALFAGRALQLPLIMCAQKPTGIDVLARSQATVFQVFSVDSKKDRDELHEYIPRQVIDLEYEMVTAPEEKLLPRYHSIWYDKNRRYVTRLPGSPPEEESFERIADRMAPPPDQEPTPEQLEAMQPKPLHFPKKRVKV